MILIYHNENVTSLEYDNKHNLVQIPQPVTLELSFVPYQHDHANSWGIEKHPDRIY